MRKILDAILHRRQFENELSEELAHHVAARAGDLERQGVPKAAAERQARLELGAGERYKEECRQARGLRWLDELRADLLYAFRGLRRNKAFAAVAILTLALGLGANTAVFSLVNAVMLKSLPVEKPEQLHFVHWTLPEKARSYHKNSNGSSFTENALRVADMFSYPHFTKLRDDTSGAALFAWANSGRLSTLIHGEAQLTRGLLTSWNYFQVLGLRPALGRTFLAEDENPQAPAPAALLNYDFWATTFRADPAVIGQTITIGTKPFTIAGVLQPGFHGLEPGFTVDVFLPLAAFDSISPRPRVKDARSWWVKIGARVPANRPERTRAELEAKLVSYLRAAPVPEPYAEPKIRLLEGARGIHWLRARLEQPLRLITIVSLLILVMAVVNVGGLLLARTEARAAETSTRLALGAGRGRLVRQHLTESLMLGGLGTLGGLMLTALLGGLLPSLFGSQGEAPIVDLTPDWRFFTAASLGCVAAAFAMGLYPAWRASRLDLVSPLKRSRTGRLPLGRGLAAVQVGLSLVLLIGAAMFLRTVANLRALPLGFEPSSVLIFGADATLAGYREERLLAFYDRALAKLREVPGVRRAAVSRVTLLQGSSSSSSLYARDKDGRMRNLGEGGESLMHTVSPGYFDAAGISLLAGRDFSLADTAKSQKVLIVNRAFARMLRPDGDSVIGTTLYEDEDGKQPVVITGVVSDAKYDSLRNEVSPTYYMPFPQRSQRQASFLLKTRGDPLALVPAVRAAMREVDPRVPLYDLRTQEEQISLAMERERSLAKLLTGFGSLALTLALIGLYGVLTYSVTRRTPEIGIRMALGAAPAQLRRMIFGESLLPVLAGIAAGLGITWWFSQLLTKLVFDVQPLDPLSIGAAVLILLGGAAIAAWLPAYRASRVSPTTALRYE